MKHIPKETNNIICMSLIRGVHRSKLIGHGSLWLQVCMYIHRIVGCVGCGMYLIGHTSVLV